LVDAEWTKKREEFMNSKEFARLRKNLSKTQKEMAQLLGVSIKAIHSYEQGWRTVPPHVERQMFFLTARKRGADKTQKPCWTIKKCPAKQKKECPAWEFQAVAGRPTKNGKKKWRYAVPARFWQRSCDLITFRMPLTTAYFDKSVLFLLTRHWRFKIGNSA
jgi:DNA-binding XRE family transcriptional regulator